MPSLIAQAMCLSETLQLESDRLTTFRLFRAMRMNTDNLIKWTCARPLTDTDISKPYVLGRMILVSGCQLMNIVAAIQSAGDLSDASYHSDMPHDLQRCRFTCAFPNAACHENVWDKYSWNWTAAWSLGGLQIHQKLWCIWSSVLVTENVLHSGRL